MFRVFSKRDTHGRLLQFSSAFDAGMLDFDPSSIIGLTTWLKADSLTLVDGAAVATWIDSSPATNNAVQNTATARPIFKTGVLNGKPAVTFDGANDILIFDSNITAGPASIFVVSNRTGAKTGNQALVVTQKLSVSSRQNGNNWAAFLNSHLDAGVVTNDAFNVLSTIFRSVGDVDLITGTSVVNRVNGSSYTSRGGSGIGADPAGVDYHMGDIAEVLIYNRALSQANRDSVISYLKTKYAL